MTPPLIATVSPNYTISLKSSSGALVGKLAPGRYTIRVLDRSGDHDFHLAGPGVDEATTVVFKGTKTWKVTFRRGLYTYKCDPHEIIMKGSFRVG
jgi:plastocyanin